MTRTLFCTLYLFISSISSIISFHLFCLVVFSVCGKKVARFSYQFATLKSCDILMFKLSWNLIPVAFFKGYNRSFPPFATFFSFIVLKEINKYGFSETKFIWLLRAIFLRQFYFFRNGIFLTNTWISIFSANFLKIFSFKNREQQIFY